MAVNKNFVVKNELEVATDVILANATSKNVGIGSTQPTFTLDVEVELVLPMLKYRDSLHLLKIYR